MADPTQTKTFIAGGTIANFRAVKPDTIAGQVVLAAANTDKVIGVIDAVNGAVAGQPVDIHIAGIVYIEAQGAIAAGDLVMPNTNGRAILAAATAGANVRLLGVALDAGATGDVIRVLLSPASFQG